MKQKTSSLKKIIMPSIFAGLTFVAISSLHSCGPDEYGADKPQFDRNETTGDSTNDGGKNEPSRICNGKLSTPISFEGNIEDRVQEGFLLKNVQMDQDPVFRDEDAFDPSYSRLKLNVFAISLYGEKTAKIGGSLKLENSPSSIGFAEDYLGNISISSGMRSDGSVKVLYSSDPASADTDSDTPMTRFEISVKDHKIISIELTSPRYKQVEDENGRTITEFSGHQRMCVTSASNIFPAN